MRIFLTGFMGAGKTTYGKKLAHKLNVPFVDLDKEIELELGKPISSIFVEHGEEMFRKMEHEILQKKLRQESFLMATGGGAPNYFQNMALMNTAGITIHLKTNESFIFNRLVQAKSERPLIQGQSEAELRNFIKKTLRERLPFYLDAQIIIDPIAFTPDKLAKQLNKLNL